MSRWLALILAYFTTRLYQLTLLPLFVDEAVHLRWTVRLVEEGRLGRMLVDGKLLHVVLMSASVPWVSNPAWWGRATTVVVGALGLWSAWRIGVHLFSRRIGWVAALLYIVCPFTFLYDRMALADTYLSSFAALVLYRSLVLQSDPSRKSGAWLGLSMAASVLSKIPGVLTLGFPPIVLLLMGRPKGWARGLGVAYGLFAALAGPFVFHFFIRTEQLGMKAGIPEEGKGRLASILYNVSLASEWLTLYWGPTLLLVVVVVAVTALLRWQRRELVLLAAAAVPLTLFVLVSFHWFPRYVLLSTVPFLILAARGLCEGYDWMVERLRWLPAPGHVVALALAGLVAWPAARVAQPLFVDPAKAPLPSVERFQYVNGWPSGYAWIDAADYLREQAEKSEIGVRVLVERADHRTALAVLWGYLMNDPRLEILPVDMRQETFRHLLIRSVHERETYVLTSGARPEKVKPIPEGNSYDLEPARSFHKPDGRLVGKLFRALPPRVSEPEPPRRDAVQDSGRKQG